MSSPQSLEELSEILENHPEIADLLYRESGETVADLIESGELADRIQSQGLVERSIPASGGPENAFEVQIMNYGPVFWIHANELDDVGYFTSMDDAEAHAFDEYDAYISAAAEEEEWDEDDEEDDDEEEENP
jgi:hypothetical protein